MKKMNSLTSKLTIAITLNFILAISVFFAGLVAQADLVLDSPQKLIEKAAGGRQPLRDVILSIQQQLPEMRNQQTFESYYLLLDQLDKYAHDYKLDDIYPQAVPALGKVMTNFGIKWVDLSVMSQDRYGYYLKWSDIDAIGNLLDGTNYILLSLNDQNVKDQERLKQLANNLEFFINNYSSVIKDRPDLLIGYRETISSLAVKFIFHFNITEPEKEFWFSKIYTSKGLTYYLDEIQNNLYAIKLENKSNLLKIEKQLVTAFNKNEILVDAPTMWLRDRIVELSLELVRKSFQFNLVLEKDAFETLVSKFAPAHLQLLTAVIVSTPENYLVSSYQNLEMMYMPLFNKLLINGLDAQANNLNIFAGTALGAVKIYSENLEGTYTLKDGNGGIWKFTIVSSSPLELSAALSDESQVIYKSFFHIRYNVADQVYTAYNSLNQNILESIEDQKMFVLKFKIQNKQITVIDQYASPQLRTLKGVIDEKVDRFDYSIRSAKSFSKIFKGKIKFDKTAVMDVEFLIQSDGQYITARLQDKSGAMYDFNDGFLNSSGGLILNTGPIASTWVQFRGNLSDKVLQGYLIVGGHGISSDEFKLTLSEEL